MSALIIATRASDLALWQANYVKEQIHSYFPHLEIELKEIVSEGDKILNQPLALIGGKGHFTKELEEAMLAGEAHIAVHSLKDVPTYMPAGLELGAITKKQEPCDVFLSHKYTSLSELPKGAIVGTTSLRRKMQILRVRPDLDVQDLRGNVNSRLKKLADGYYDAIILAYIGMDRLGLLKDVPYFEKLPIETMLPPMGQASLGIQVVSNDNEIKEIVSCLNDPTSAFCAKLERDFIATLEGSCSAPIAVHASVEDKTVFLQAMIGLPDGSKILEDSMIGMVGHSDHMGEALANSMIDQGALEILKSAEEITIKESCCERL
jgi:hydroxymethylbilane synthase